MRITGGQYKNRKLIVPDGDAVRPTSDRMRQSLFNMLHHSKWTADFEFEDSHVLDLFCGSGALGLEALSHGAKHAIFVDTDITSVKHNTHFLDNTDYEIIRQNATKLSLNTPHPFNLIFMDPPYRKGLVQPTLQNLIERQYLADNAVIIIECEKELSIDTGLETLDTRAQGQSTLYIFRYQSAI